MAGMTASVLLRLKDQFSPALKNAGSNVEKFGGAAMGAVNKIDKAFSGTAARLAGFGLTLGLGAAAKGLIDFDAEITRMGVQAGITDGEIQNLKQTIFDTATDPKIKLGYQGISDSMSEVIEMTGDMDFAEANIRNMGIAMRATASEGKAIGGLFSEFQKMGLGAEEVTVAMDTLATQGNNGAFTLANLAALGPRTINAYLASGRNGTTALTEMGAALQVIRRGTGSSEQAATAFEAVMRNLTNPQKQEALAKMGIAVRDQAGNFRSITDIMEEIVLKSNGSLETIGTLFDAEAVRAFNSAIGEFQRTGAVTSFKQFEGMLGDGSELEKAAARNAGTLKANIEGLQSAFMKFANSSVISDFLEKITGLLNELAEDPERVQRVFKTIAAGFAAIAAVKGIAAVGNIVKSISSFFGQKSLAVPGISGGAAAGMPVYVTNWGGTPGTGAATGIPSRPDMAWASPGAGTPAAGAPVSMGQNVRAAIGGITPQQMAAGGIMGGLTGAAIAIPQMIGELNDIKANTDLVPQERGKATGGAIGQGVGTVAGGVAGGVGGVFAGAAAGAAIGSIVPGLGTAAGAIVGGLVGTIGLIVGGKAGRAIGEGIGEAVAKENIPGAIQGQINSVPQIPAYLQNNSMMFGGQASMAIDLRLTDERVIAGLRMVNNTMPVKYNLGSMAELRRMGG